MPYVQSVLPLVKRKQINIVKNILEYTVLQLYSSHALTHPAKHKQGYAVSSWSRPYFISDLQNTKDGGYVHGTL